MIPVTLDRWGVVVVVAGVVVVRLAVAVAGLVALIPGGVVVVGGGVDLHTKLAARVAASVAAASVPAAIAMLCERRPRTEGQQTHDGNR